MQFALNSFTESDTEKSLIVHACAKSCLVLYSIQSRCCCTLRPRLHTHPTILGRRLQPLNKNCIICKMFGTNCKRFIDNFVKLNGCTFGWSEYVFSQKFNIKCVQMIMCDVT